MTPWLVNLLCDPQNGDPLRLESPQYDDRSRIISGWLVSPAGRRYPIRNGVPRFVESSAALEAVRSFGDEWNIFNFTRFRLHWLNHTVKNTFGSTEIFRDKIVVDAGAGSGAQALWMLESGAKHVILLELSHSVDGVIQENLNASPFLNWDVVQCSIDAPPLKEGSIDGIVICHNVIQHTPSVERTARALYRLVAPGGEFVFNCYPLNDKGLVRWIRFHGVYQPLRALLSRAPFAVNYAYAELMACLRLVPVLGWLLEKAGLCVQGEVLSERGAPSLADRFCATRLNTFDAFGSHAYQHHKSDDEIRTLVAALQPDPAKTLNMSSYFSRPAPIGCALRVRR